MILITISISILTNSFIFKNPITIKIITINKKNCLIYLVNKYKKIQILYQRLQYTCNTKIIYIAKFIIYMNSFNKKYNLVKIYNNLNILESEIKE